MFDLVSKKNGGVREDCGDRKSHGNSSPIIARCGAVYPLANMAPMQDCPDVDRYARQ
jgi:hypothetical protein